MTLMTSKPLHPLDSEAVEFRFHFLVEIPEAFEVFADVSVVSKVNVVDGNRMVLCVVGNKSFVFFDAVF